MDFSHSETQEAVRELALRIFSENVDHARLRELDRAGIWFDDALWHVLADAGLTALSLPESVGGGGMGIFEVGLLLEEMGRAVAPVPLLPTLVLGAAPIAEFGNAAQRERWLRPVAERAGVLTAALAEAGASDPSRPELRATPDGGGYRLRGEKICVPAAQLAHGIVVPARTGVDRFGLFIVDPNAAGLTLERQLTTNREPHGRLTFDDVHVDGDDVLGDSENGSEMLAWLLLRARIALCATQLGVAEEALRRTAEYTRDRHQFERPIGSFQGVALRAADAFIDIACMRSTLTLAIWRISADLPAHAETAAAKWWACRGGQRIVHTAQHLHGGIGSDLDYPLHRFYLWSKQLELTLGGAGQQLEILGELLLADPAPSPRAISESRRAES